MSVARFIADQRTNYRVPHASDLPCCWGCACPGSTSGAGRPPTTRQRRRAEVDAAVKAAFDAAGGAYGSPRIHADLRDAGWMVTEKTVADSMRRQGLLARKVKHRKGMTKQDGTAPKFPDLVNRDFTAAPAMCAAYECGEILVIAPRGAVTCQGRGARCTTKATPRWLVLSAPRKSSPHLRLSPRRL